MKKKTKISDRPKKECFEAIIFGVLIGVFCITGIIVILALRNQIDGLW